VKLGHSVPRGWAWDTLSHLRCDTNGRSCWKLLIELVVKKGDRAECAVSFLPILEGSRFGCGEALRLKQSGHRGHQLLRVLVARTE